MWDVARTVGIHLAHDVVQLRIAVLELAVLYRPRNGLADEAVLRGLVRWKGAEDRKDLSYTACMSFMAAPSLSIQPLCLHRVRPWAETNEDCDRDGSERTFGLAIDCRVPLSHGLDHEQAQIAAAPALACLEQRESAFVKDVDGGIPVGLLGVARSDDA